MGSLFELLNNLDSIVVAAIIVLMTFIISFGFTFVISRKLRGTKSFFLTSVLMPVIVSAVISMVSVFLDSTSSGAVRIATIAVALGLVRFRSANARAEELVVLFAGIAVGLIAGLGFVVFAAILAILVGLLYFVLTSVNLFNNKRFGNEKLLKITIPESLEYNGIFNETFENYLKKYELIEVKTTGMGSLFRLSYVITFKNADLEKAFIDEIRTKNGNLEISILPYVIDNKNL